MPSASGSTDLGSVLLVRHARPSVDPLVHRSRWALSSGGRREARLLGEVLTGTFDGWPLVCSTERKATETASLVRSRGVDPLVLDGLVEVACPWYERPEDHRRVALEYLGGHDVDGWEPAARAVRRFDASLRMVSSSFVVAVSHGKVLSLWARSVVAGLDAGAYWTGLSMPDAWLVDVARRTMRRVW